MILVVDDHADTRTVLIRLLKLEGYEATGADCGDAALRAVKASAPHLVILDCHMPGMDGLAVLRAMNGDARLRDVPVIMFSAAGEREERLARELGAKAFIRKGSLDWPTLRVAVNKHLTGPTG